MKTNDLNTAIYPHSAAYAKEHGELEQYRASNRANLNAKEAIESAVREHFDGMYLSRDAAKDVIETYGIDRVMFVLANTVQLQDWDGRYSPATRRGQRPSQRQLRYCPLRLCRKQPSRRAGWVYRSGPYGTDAPALDGSGHPSRGRTDSAGAARTGC